MSGRSRTAAPRRVDPPGRARHLSSILIFATAALIRVAVAASLWDLPLVRTPKLDSAEYLMWAQRLAAGDWAWPSVAQHGPGYPMFLAALLVAGSESLKAVMVLQAVLGACTAVLIALIARRMAGPRAGAIAGLAYALYGPAVYIDTAILAEGLLLFLLTLALWALTSDRPPTARRSALAGAALGAAALVRPTALIVAACCLGWVVWRRLAWKTPATLILAGAAVLAPAIAKNWSASGTLSIQGYGGLNAYIGDSPRHDGRATFRLGGGWDALNAEAPRAGIADAAAQDRYYLEKTAREIALQPLRFLRLIAVKALWLVQAEESRDSHSYYFFTAHSALLRLLPGWWLLFPLACAGILVVRRPSLLVFYSAGAAASVVLLVVGFRYRMPLVPAMAIATGAGMEGLASAVAARRGRTVAVAGAAFCAALAVSHLLRDPRNRNLAEEWALTGSSLVTEHRLAEAESAYRHAIDLDPRSGLAWDGLGLTFYNSGQLVDARKAYERALAIDADSARTIYHLAVVDDREGRLGPAADGYERARALSPFDADMTHSLAGARRRQATELGMSGRTGEARDALRRALEIAPDDGDAWLDLCLLSLDLGDRDAAIAALARARALGTDQVRLAFAEEALRKRR